MSKNKKVKLRYVVLFAIVIYSIISVVNQRMLVRDLELKKQQLKEEIVALEEDVKNLDETIKNSDSSEFIEKVAREDLGMVKPNEIIYVDKNKKNNKSSSSKSENN